MLFVIKRLKVVCVIKRLQVCWKNGQQSWQSDGGRSQSNVVSTTTFERRQHDRILRPLRKNEVSEHSSFDAGRKRSRQIVMANYSD